MEEKETKRVKETDISRDARSNRRRNTAPTTIGWVASQKRSLPQSHVRLRQELGSCGLILYELHKKLSTHAHSDTEMVERADISQYIETVYVGVILSLSILD